MLARMTESLIEVVIADRSTTEDLQVAGQSFFNAIESASVEEVNAAMKKLSHYFDLENPSRVAFLALVCGALIEGVTKNYDKVGQSWTKCPINLLFI